MSYSTNWKSKIRQLVRSGLLLWIGSLLLVVQSQAQEKIVVLTPSEPELQGARADVSQMTDAEAQKFIREALTRQLPNELNDDVYLLAKSRRQVVLPELIAHLRNAQQDPTTTTEYIHTLADVIAYAADESAVDTLLEFASMDGERFGRYVGRLLDYTYGRKNPYVLAYHAINRADATSAVYVIAWVEQSMTIETNVRAWAEAIAEQNKEAPSEEALASDPIISKIPGGTPESLKKELLKIAREARGKPNQQ